jgi:hypothetical protein
VQKQYIVGIDLGTSNTVVAYAAPGKQQVELFEIEQLVGPGQVAARPLLPSVRYHPASGELSFGDFQLPRGQEGQRHNFMIGSIHMVDVLTRCWHGSPEVSHLCRITRHAALKPLKARTNYRSTEVQRGRP